MRLLGMVLCALALTVGQLNAQPVPPVAAAQFVQQSRLLEHLVKHSDQLLTEINLTRGGLFRIAPQVIEGMRRESPWVNRFVEEVLVVPPGVPAEQGTSDFIIGIQANNFRLAAIGSYEGWQHKKVYGPAAPAFENQFPVTMQGYYNALSSTYFYIEALRRTYLINQAFTTCYDAQLLERRLIKLERLAFEIRELMHMMRHTAGFGIQMRNGCVECRYGAIRINVQARVPQRIVTFLFFAKNQVWAPKALMQGQAVGVEQNFRPQYDVTGWDKRWEIIDQGYIQGYQNNLPNSTPVNPPQGQLQPFLPNNQGVQPPPMQNQNPFQTPLNPQTRPQQFPQQGGQPQGPQQFPQQGGLPPQQFPQQGGQPPQYPSQGGQPVPQTRPQYPTQPPTQPPTNPGEDIVPLRDFNG